MIPHHKLIDKGPGAEGEPQPWGFIALREVGMDAHQAALWHAANFPVRITETKYAPV